jgi:hypothetical protein
LGSPIKEILLCVGFIGVVGLVEREREMGERRERRREREQELNMGTKTWRQSTSGKERSLHRQGPRVASRLPKMLRSKKVELEEAE